MACTVTEAPRHILLIRPSALGDVCRSAPLAVSLKRAHPEATLTWLVQDAFADVIEAHPAVDRVLRFPRSTFARFWRDPRVAMSAIRWAASLRRARFDLVIDAQGLWRSGVMSWLTGARRRVGYRSAREFGWLGYTVRHPGPKSKHAVDAMLELVEREGIEPVRDLRLTLRPDDAAWWRRQRVELSVGERYAVFAPGSRWLSKRWPAERFAALAPRVLAMGYESIVIIGSPDEREQALRASPLEAPRVINLAGGTRVGQTMAIIAGSSLVVANDSAPLHMAVGFDRPLVGLYGPTDPAAVGPYGRLDAVVRRVEPADAAISYKDPTIGDRLMRRIEVQDVAEMAERVSAAHRPVDLRQPLGASR